MAQPARKREPELKRRAKALVVDIEARARRRLAERVRLAREAQKRAVRRIRAWAKKEKKAISARAQAARARCLARVATATRRERELVRERRALMLASAKRKLGAVEVSRKRELERELAHQRLLKERERTRIKRSTARERAQESDDAVRSNLEPEMLPVWERVKRGIRGGPRRTRTEAFLEWVGEHPDEVLAIQAEHVEQDVAKLVGERHEAERRRAREKKAGRGFLSAVWRGRTFDLALRPARATGDKAVHRLRVEGKGPGERTWEVTHRAVDDDWELGELVKGRPPKDERSAVATWVDTLDGWNPLDDLRDVEPEAVPF